MFSIILSYTVKLKLSKEPTTVPEGIKNWNFVIFEGFLK